MMGITAYKKYLQSQKHLWKYLDWNKQGRRRKFFQE